MFLDRHDVGAVSDVVNVLSVRKWREVVRCGPQLLGEALGYCLADAGNSQMVDHKLGGTYAISLEYGVEMFSTPIPNASSV
jgi:hypothetical protein